ALTAEAGMGNAKRKVSGADSSRVAMIIAILEKHSGLRLIDRDVFVNIVGGIKLTDPSADAAIALAIASAHMNRGLASNAVVLGELGLLGEFRPIAQLAQRLTEADRLGFATGIIPATRSKAGLPKLASMELVACRTLDQAIQQLG
ncbi:MAG: magnesium chelatase domain-containing protein, partial [Phycisphaerae bacterium]